MLMPLVIQLTHESPRHLNKTNTLSIPYNADNMSTINEHVILK